MIYQLIYIKTNYIKMLICNNKWSTINIIDTLRVIRMSAKTFESIFDEELSHLKFNDAFIDGLYHLERSFYNGREDNIIFLNNTLLGTPPFRFYQSDRDAFFDDVLEQEERIISEALSELGTDYYDPSTKKVASDPFNLSGIYVIFKIRKSNLTNKSKIKGEVAMWRLIHYRWLGSLMSRYFPHTPNKAIMENTIALLNNRFELKRSGSWLNWIDSRIKDLMSDTSIHRKRIDTMMTKTFSSNDGINYVVTDTQGRVRSVVKYIYPMFEKARTHEGGVATRKSTISLEDGVKVRDVIKSSSKYKEYLRSTLSSRDNFIKSELMLLTENIITTVNSKNLITTLEYLTDNYGAKGDKRVAVIIDTIVNHAIESLSDNPSAFRNTKNVADIVDYLKSLYTSSRTSNPSVLLLRSEIEKIVTKVTKIKNPTITGSTRNGVMVYLILRTFSINYYS